MKQQRPSQIFILRQPPGGIRYGFDGTDVFDARDGIDGQSHSVAYLHVGRLGLLVVDREVGRSVCHKHDAKRAAQHGRNLALRIPVGLYPEYHHLVAGHHGLISSVLYLSKKCVVNAVHLAECLV